MSQPLVEITGFAIVSDDNMIADAAGEVPPQLRNETDWKLYQAAQAESDLVAFTRVSHENEPNTRGEARLVISRTGKGLERREGDWWWDPAEAGWPEALAFALPTGGKIAVGGGRGAFDLFLDVGYFAFHLVRAHGVRLPGGRPIFTDCRNGASAEQALERKHLHVAERFELDKAQRVEKLIFRAAGAPTSQDM